jgi:transcriptional regulator with XRE-family HTH domain
MKRSEKSVFSERLDRALRFQHITRSEFARLLEVSRVTVHAWVTGSSFPTVDRLTHIANTLGVTTAYLVGHEKPVKLTPNFLEHQRRALSIEGESHDELKNKFDDFHEYVTFLRNRTRRIRIN